MSERARALEQAREWQAIAYGDRPETWAALDYYRELGWPVDSNKFPERERVEGRIFAFMSGYREALKAAVDHPPPSGASPQAETSEDMGDGWYVTVGRWGESLVTIEQRCLSGNADLTDDDAALIRGAAKHLQAFIGQPAPVSPVEPESSSFEANTASNLLQKVELSTLDRYRNTNQMDVDTWMVRAVASSEPRSEDDLVLLDHVIALLKPTVEPEPPTLEPCAHELDYHNCAECVGPKVEPEPPICSDPHLLKRGCECASCLDPVRLKRQLLEVWEKHRAFVDAVASALHVESERGPVSEVSVIEAARDTLNQLLDSPTVEPEPPTGVR